MSIFKTLIKTKTGEWAVYQCGAIHTASTPTVLANTASIELLKDYHKCFEERQEPIDWKDYEIVEVKIDRI